MADVIVVLGAALYPDGGPSPAMEKRVAAAARAFESGKGSRLLLSGGPTTSSTPEADVMARLAIQAGVPEDCIVRERVSLNTWSNGIECARIIEAEGWQRVILVTDRAHLPRAKMIFRLQGIKTVGLAAEGRLGSITWEVAAWAKFLTLLVRDLVTGRPIRPR